MSREWEDVGEALRIVKEARVLQVCDYLLHAAVRQGSSMIPDLDTWCGKSSLKSLICEDCIPLPPKLADTCLLTGGKSCKIVEEVCRNTESYNYHSIMFTYDEGAEERWGQWGSMEHIEWGFFGGYLDCRNPKNLDVVISISIIAVIDQEEARFQVVTKH